MLPETTNYVQTGSLFSHVEPGQVEGNLEKSWSGRGTSAGTSANIGKGTNKGAGFKENQVKIFHRHRMEHTDIPFTD